MKNTYCYVIENQTNIHHTGKPLYLCSEPYKRYLESRKEPWYVPSGIKIKWTSDFNKAVKFADFREATMNKIFVDHRFLKRLKRKIKISKKEG